MKGCSRHLSAKGKNVGGRRRKPTSRIEWLTLAMKLDNHKSGPIELSQHECGIVADAMAGLLRRIETLEDQLRDLGVTPK